MPAELRGSRHRRGALPSDDGGLLKTEIAANNKAALLAEIATLDPLGWTPLSETLVDVGLGYIKLGQSANDP